MRLVVEVAACESRFRDPLTLYPSYSASSNCLAGSVLSLIEAAFGGYDASIPDPGTHRPTACRVVD